MSNPPIKTENFQLDPSSTGNPHLVVKIHKKKLGVSVSMWESLPSVVNGFPLRVGSCQHVGESVGSALPLGLRGVGHS